jgi:thiamine biosynthesis lipoprotein
MGTTTSPVVPTPTFHGEDLLARTEALMDRFVTIGLVRGAGADTAAIGRTFDWFRRVEAACNCFDAASEILGLLNRVGEPTPVSAILYEAVSFALAVAWASDGAFDPTTGHRRAAHGFARNYRTGATIATPQITDDRATFRDIVLDPDSRTITLRCPLLLDLGAVARGLAIDLVGQELPGTPGALIEAGGDVGDYAPPAPVPGSGHHLLDPRVGRSPQAVASVTTIVPPAMAADALGTAAFIRSPRRGIHFLAEQDAAELLVRPALSTYTTSGFARYYA